MRLIHDLIGKTYLTDDDLARVFVGKRASDFTELLSYADEYSADGSSSRYRFIVLYSELSDPSDLQEGDGTMLISVDGDTIVDARCAIYEI